MAGSDARNLVGRDLNFISRIYFVSFASFVVTPLLIRVLSVFNPWLKIWSRCEKADSIWRIPFRFQPVFLDLFM